MALNREVIISDPDVDFSEGSMQFRLTYEGELLGASRSNHRADHKHEIRAKLHPQLKQLWKTNKWLLELSEYRFPDFRTAISGMTLKNPAWSRCETYGELVSKHYNSQNRNWMPLVCDEMNLTCGLDILFLRRGARGNLLNVGDIDGRIKTLFDALAVPKSGSALPDPEKDQPFHVLLSDDGHISHLSVETDELLEPTSLGAGPNDSRIIITVNVKPIQTNFITLGFSSF